MIQTDNWIFQSHIIIKKSRNKCSQKKDIQKDKFNMFFKNPEFMTSSELVK